MTKPMLTLLEGKWFANKNVSARDLFQPLFNVWMTNSESSCHYEQFTTVAGFHAGMTYAFKNHRASIIYVGAHGDDKMIHGFHDAGISRTKIKNAMLQQPAGTKRGVYFGACGFMTEENAKLLLNQCPRLSWVGGYESAVNWTDSGLLDLCFFRHLLFPTPGKGNKAPTTNKSRLEHAVKKMTADVGPLAKRLHFKVYTRRQGGGVVELVEASANTD